MLFLPFGKVVYLLDICFFLLQILFLYLSDFECKFNIFHYINANLGGVNVDFF